mgnify:CR=1 FL=1
MLSFPRPEAVEEGFVVVFDTADAFPSFQPGGQGINVFEAGIPLPLGTLEPRQVDGAIARDLEHPGILRQGGNSALSATSGASW